MAELQILEGPISVDTYRHLRSICGLSDKTVKAAETGLKNSVYSVMAKQAGKVIAMGRIVGDGGCFCQIVDICVHPEHQGMGIGKMIMENLVRFIRRALPESCFISLIADGNAAFLYEKFGFKDTLPESKGMYLRR
ncbi:MAG: GNAT family N-acetyltransferase [Lewinellaceae bacterium]|jgi:ribosomal protein S18 acetylase RimI-like enzyme|nr:GNAT family N-acetyltransferase [Lewinellaceae bacterium]